MSAFAWVFTLSIPIWQSDANANAENCSEPIGSIFVTFIINPMLKVMLTFMQTQTLGTTRTWRQRHEVLCRQTELLCHCVAWLSMLLFTHNDKKKWQQHVVFVKCEQTPTWTSLNADIVCKLIAKVIFRGNWIHTFISKANTDCWLLRGERYLNRIVLLKGQLRKGPLAAELVPIPFVDCDFHRILSDVKYPQRGLCK